jgi:hypothetical protein
MTGPARGQVANDDVELVKGSHLRWDLPREYAVRRAVGAARSLNQILNTCPCILA